MILLRMFEITENNDFTGENEKYGGRYWARTSDPLLVREVLSQLS